MSILIEMCIAESTKFLKDDLPKLQLNPVKKVQAGRVISSVISDERFRNGEVHTSTRHFENGRVLLIEYSTDWIEKFIAGLIKESQEERK